MTSDRDVSALVMVKGDRGKGYEVRVALYGSGGALVREESYSGIRSIYIDASINIVKIGYGELYLLSRGEIEISFRNGKGVVTISRKSDRRHSN